MLRITSILASMLALSGCASTIGTFFNRPVVEDGVDKAVSTISLSADRRTVIVVTEPGANRAKFCAEPPPDAAVGLKAQLEAALKGKSQTGVDAEGQLAESFQSDVTVIAERTASLDVFRTGVYALCQLHLNGAVTGPEVKVLFEGLLKAYADADLKRAEKDPSNMQADLDRTRRELDAARKDLDKARDAELDRARKDLLDARAEAGRKNE
ncbi:hypothetical protein [Aromatoleum petrolei]|uniref:Lipoprotein n=1 Tax=Aromatoleum petrolei TaxID=76116 RepID=A0ABX1MH31_9RHOO|nr:hypothetical protein [Aromatoleum petrolei]NMF87230.1 hypothetical protein [Aromatoleum petrolei]QTQ38473.1 Uncharacterized protein ToN1_43750 [Aromatoleum petrolei]